MPDLILDITGLCAFVPRRQTPAGPDRSATALLVSREVQGHAGIDLHLPALVVRDDDRDKSSRMPDAYYYDRQGQLQAVFWLDGQEITITGLRPGFILVDDAIGNCPLNGDANSVSWIAPLPRIDAAWGTVNPTCLLPVPNALISGAVGARIQLTAGSLYSLAFFADESRIPLRCGFKLPSGATSALQQAISDQVELVASIGSPQVAFAASSLRDGSASYQDVTLNASADLKVAIKNLPAPVLFGTAIPPKVVLGQPFDSHFEHLYRFVQNGPAAGQGYLYYPIEPCTGPSAVQSPKCPPAYFAPVVG